MVDRKVGYKLYPSYVTLEHLEEPVKVYNFEVEDWHTYYVAEQGALVHNKECSTTVGGSSQIRKPINRPSSEKVKIDMKRRINWSKGVA